MFANLPAAEAAGPRLPRRWAAQSCAPLASCAPRSLAPFAANREGDPPKGPDVNVPPVHTSVELGNAVPLVSTLAASCRSSASVQPCVACPSRCRAAADDCVSACV
jgi:hypothetical protein